MSSLSKKVLALIAGGAGAVSIATAFLGEKEGVRYTAYRDSSGIWTNCMGNTRGVYPGQVLSAAECDRIDLENVAEAAVIVDKLVKVPMSEPQKAAVISFCAFNIGPGKCAESTFLRKMNAGDKVGACAEIKRWIFDRGRDCRERGNNCYGQVIRRQQEQELCLM